MSYLPVQSATTCVLSEPAAKAATIIPASRGISHATFVVPMDEGLHLRPIQVLVERCSRYPNCNITVKRHDGESANAKQALDLMFLAVDKGEELHLYCEGDDHETALADVLDLMHNFPI